MPLYSLHSRLPTTPASRDRLVAILTKAAELLAHDPACLLYLIHHDAQDPGSVWVTEVWTDEQAHDASLERADVRALIGEAAPLLNGAPTQTKMEAVAGTGLPGA